MAVTVARVKKKEECFRSVLRRKRHVQSGEKVSLCREESIIVVFFSRPFGERESCLFALYPWSVVEDEEARDHLLAMLGGSLTLSYCISE